MTDNAFKKAVDSTIEIKNHYCSGLQAIKGNERKMIVPKDPKKISGSVDIDNALTKLDPHGARWDYAIGYEDKAYFVEVHPANTSNIQEMINKVDWLKKWLKEKAASLNAIGDKTFYLVPSGKVAILKNSPQHRKLSQNKLRIATPIMSLPPK